MRYAKLSCFESYSCHLQQSLSIDLFSYRNPVHGQKGDIYEQGLSVLLFGSFLRIGSLVFSGTQHGVRGPCRVVHDKARCFENNVLLQNEENKPSLGFFECRYRKV